MESALYLVFDISKTSTFELKSYKRNMQELSDSIKRTNLRINGIEEGEEVQAKEI
jgi:hypothetical protein